MDTTDVHSFRFSAPGHNFTFSVDEEGVSITPMKRNPITTLALRPSDKPSRAATKNLSKCTKCKRDNVNEGVHQMAVWKKRISNLEDALKQETARKKNAMRSEAMSKKREEEMMVLYDNKISEHLTTSARWNDVERTLLAEIHQLKAKSSAIEDASSTHSGSMHPLLEIQKLTSENHALRERYDLLKKTLNERPTAADMAEVVSQKRALKKQLSQRDAMQSPSVSAAAPPEWASERRALRTRNAELSNDLNQSLASRHNAEPKWDELRRENATLKDKLAVANQRIAELEAPRRRITAAPIPGR